MSRSRNGETTPRHDETTISAADDEQLAPVVAEEPADAAQVRLAHRRVGGALDLLARRERAAGPGMHETVPAWIAAVSRAARPRPRGRRGYVRRRRAASSLPQQRVGLLAVAAPRDPALRVDHVEGREVADAGRPSRPCRACRASGKVPRSCRVGIEQRREGQAEVDVVGEDARRVLAVRRRPRRSAYLRRRQRPRRARAGAAPRRRSAGTRWRRTRAAPPCRGSRRG